MAAKDYIFDALAPVLAGRWRWALLHARWEEVASWLAAGCEKVDHTITDPPYTKRTHKGARTSKDGGKATPIHFAALKDLAHVEPLLALTNYWTLNFCELEMLGDYRRAAGDARYIRGGVWDRPDGKPQQSGDRPAQGAEGIAIMHSKGRKRWNGGGRRAWWCCGIERDERIHPTQKPVRLLMDLLLDFTKPDDLVFDPFAGVASVGVACLRTGRRYIGVEKSIRWVRWGLKRCEAASQGLVMADVDAGQLPLLAAAP